jgi:nucleoside phosphorylase
VAGETLLGDPKADYQKQVLTDYYRAIAVDMESMGVGREVYHQRRSPYYNPQYIVVRGISDYVYVDESGMSSTKKKKKKAPTDNQSTRDKWRVYAAESAAAFALEMVDSLLREFGKQYSVP